MSPSPDPTQPPLSVDSLLDHSEWLQALARRLARDESSAQDLVQRVWLVALRRPPEERAGSPRGWLAAVLRNEARMESRSRARGASREAESVRGRPRESPAPEEGLVSIEERFELQLRLMDAVRSLEEPLRSAVLLRYFERQSLAAIAQRTHVPVRTVEARLRRAREVLRQRLDGHFGHRSAWLLLAVPLAPSAPPVTGAPLRPSPTLLSAATTVMGTKAFIGSAAAVTALLVASYLAYDSRATGVMESPEAVANGDAAARGGSAQTRELVSLEPTAGRRADLVTDPVETDGVEPGLALVQRTIQGVAFHGDGQPFAGLELRLVPPVAEVESVRTSDSGEFEFEAEVSDEIRSRVTPESDALVVLARRPITSETWSGNLPGLVAVAPAASVRGSVRSSDGEAIEGATLTIQLPENFAARFSDAFWRVTRGEWMATSIESGTFHFEIAPALEGCTLTVEADGFKPFNRPISPAAETVADPQSVDVTLERIDPSASITGRVLDPSGEPVEEALVGLGSLMEVTGTDGRFEFQTDKEAIGPEGAIQLFAAAEGWQVTTYSPRLDGKEQPVWPAHIELRFTEQTLSIAGVLFDASGAPKGEGVVWLEDPTVIGVSQGTVTTSEELAGPRRTLWQTYPTDKDGRFAIPGLNGREYRVAAMDLRNLHLATATEVRAGTTDAVIQLNPTVPMARIRGRIVDAGGDPIPEASISLRRLVLFLGHPNKRSANVDYGQTEKVLTDPKGRFDLGEVPLHPGTALYLHKSNYTLQELPLTDLPLPLARLEIVLGSMCRARIVAHGLTPRVPTWAEVRNAAGEALQVTTARENGASWSTGIDLIDGDSMTFQVSGAAVEAVLYAGGEIVATLPLRLNPEGIHEIVP